MEIRDTITLLENLNKPVIAEGLDLAKAHLTHPEDLVVKQGAHGIGNALKIMTTTVKKPHEITVKWDGSPALIFGVGQDGKFRILDKHMFNKADDSGRNVTSPKAFAQYDINRGVDRGTLPQAVSNMWTSLKAACGGQPGYYWGDMLFGDKLVPQGDLLVFKANPTGLTYKVDVNSDVGQMMLGKLAGIAVHQFIPVDAHEKANQANQQAAEQGEKGKYAATDFAESLNGSLGKLKVPANSKVAIVPSKMPITPTLDKNNWELYSKKVANDASQLAQSIDAFVALGDIKGLNASYNNEFHAWLESYINSEIRNIKPDMGPEDKESILSKVGAAFPTYVTGRIAKINEKPLKLPKAIEERQRNQAVLLNHIKTNNKGMINTYRMWYELYKLKMMIYGQINTTAKDLPVKGFIDPNSEEESQEGFVAHGVKYVDRAGFSAANLGGQRSGR